MDLPSLKMKKWDWFRDTNSTHKKVEKAFVAMLVENFATLNATRAPLKHKVMQMAVVFYLLQFGRSMTEYPPIKELLHIERILQQDVYYSYKRTSTHSKT